MDEHGFALNRVIMDLLGVKVSVRSILGNGDAEDIGILEEYDHPWVRLRTTDREVLCFPVHNIRLVKNLEPLKKVEIAPGEALLRPVNPVELIPRG